MKKRRRSGWSLIWRGFRAEDASESAIKFWAPGAHGCLPPADPPITHTNKLNRDLLID